MPGMQFTAPQAKANLLRSAAVTPIRRRSCRQKALSKALRRAGWQVLRPDLLHYNRLVETTPTSCLRPCVGSKNMSSPIRSVNCSHFVMLFCSKLAVNCMIDGKGLNKCSFYIHVWLARQVTMCDRVSACFAASARDLSHLPGT